MNWTAWQPWAIGAIAVAVMLRYVIRALFADRARGRPRCLRCGHPFAAGQGLTCAECGWTARRPEDLLRTRRHWGKAALAFGIMLALAVTVRLVALGGDPLMLMPSRALVILLPFDPAGVGGRGPIADELRNRLIGDELSAATESALVERVVRGDAGARPSGDRWTSRYGMLADDLRERHGSPSDPLATVMLELPPLIELSLPDGWPATSPVPAELVIRDWWPAGTEALVRLGPAGLAATDDAWHEIGYRNHASIQRRHHLTLPPTATWPEDGRVEVALRLRRVDPERAIVEEAPSRDDWMLDDDAIEVRAMVPVVRPNDRPAPSLERWPGDEFADAAVAAVFDRGLRRWPGVRRPYAIRFNPNRLSNREFDGIHFGLVVEIIERRTDGEELVRRRTRMWIPGGGLVPTRRRASGWTISEEDTDGLAGAFDAKNDSTWFLRIRGDETLAGLAALIAKAGEVGVVGVDDDDVNAASGASRPERWWAGTVERPLPVERADGRPFIRMWFHPEGVRPPVD